MSLVPLASLLRQLGQQHVRHVGQGSSAWRQRARSVVIAVVAEFPKKKKSVCSDFTAQTYEDFDFDLMSLYTDFFFFHTQAKVYENFDLTSLYMALYADF